MNRVLGVYQASTRLYPRCFREEYGDDLVALAALQLTDGRRPLVVARLVLDLSVSIPSQHLENLMNRPPRLLLSVLSGGVAATTAVMAVLLGSAVSVLLLLVAVVAAVVAAWSYSAARIVREPQLARRWWQALVGGGVLLGVLLLSEAFLRDSLALPWLAMVFLLVFGWVLLAGGVILGVLHAVRLLRGRVGPVGP